MALLTIFLWAGPVDSATSVKNVHICTCDQPVDLCVRTIGFLLLLVATAALLVLLPWGSPWGQYVIGLITSGPGTTSRRVQLPATSVESPCSRCLTHDSVAPDVSKTSGAGTEPGSLAQPLVSAKVAPQSQDAPFATADNHAQSPLSKGRMQIVIVEDELVNQAVLRALLGSEYDLLEMMSGEELLEYIETAQSIPDVILLDVGLPGMNGYQVCERLRERWTPSELPIIMLTASGGEQAVISGFNVGASDYMVKPLRSEELKARIHTQVALKRSVKLAMEAATNMDLLKSILPHAIIKQLKQGIHGFAQHHSQVTVLFSDIKSFTNMASSWPTERIICMLNEMFSAFDSLCEEIGVYKVETIGDAYMIVSGHDGVVDHATRMLRMATAMIGVVEAMGVRWEHEGQPLQIRVGIHTGPAHSGVVGTTRPRYTFFGDTINVASRMETTSYPMACHVSDATRACVEDGLAGRTGPLPPPMFMSCGPRAIKGKGNMRTHFLKIGKWKEALASVTKSEPQVSPGFISTDLGVCVSPVDAAPDALDCLLGSTEDDLWTAAFGLGATTKAVGQLASAMRRPARDSNTDTGDSFSDGGTRPAITIQQPTVSKRASYPSSLENAAVSKRASSVTFLAGEASGSSEQPKPSALRNRLSKCSSFRVHDNDSPLASGDFEDLLGSSRPSPASQKQAAELVSKSKEGTALIELLADNASGGSRARSGRPPPRVASSTWLQRAGTGGSARVPNSPGRGSLQLGAELLDLCNALEEACD